MKIMNVSIRNFRNIEHLDKNLDGHNIILLAENQKGKSNFIKALELSLGMTEVAGVNPIMNGKKEANIQVVTDDNGNKYTFEVKFKEGSDKPTITVTAPDGLRSSSKTIIGSIVGEINFDIDSFIEMSKTPKGRKEQVEIVKSFLPTEVKEDLRIHENKIVTMYEDRTNINRDIKTLSGFIKESELSEDDMRTYFQKEDASKLTEELNQAIAVNQNISKANQKSEELDRYTSTNVFEIEKLRKQILEKEKENEELMLQKLKIERWLKDKKNQPIDTVELQAKIAKATDHNLKHQKVNDVRTQLMKLEQLQSDSESLTILIDTTRQLVSDTIKDLDMPVEGLSFTDDMLTYNGSPVDESTLSTSEIMMLGVKLKMAKNPKAKVLFIERGESLGTEKLRALQEMSKKCGYQIIIEQVARGVEELKIEIMPEIEEIVKN